MRDRKVELYSAFLSDNPFTHPICIKRSASLSHSPRLRLLRLYRDVTTTGLGVEDELERSGLPRKDGRDPARFYTRGKSVLDLKLGLDPLRAPKSRGA